MWIVVTDLDGTLLNHGDYSWAGARIAMDSLERHGVPVIFCTSKTRAEVEQLREATGNRHPFIVENGGAVLLPEAEFRRVLPDMPAHDGLLVRELGTRYPLLVESLRDAAREANCTVKGFAEATVAEVAAWCEFTEGEAVLAMQREYDEPFLLEAGSAAHLQAAIEARGLRWTRGGRFWHILGENDKGAAVRVLREVYARFGHPVQVAALGDSPNDLPLLEEAEFPIVMPSPRLEEMRARLPQARVAPAAGSLGWGRAVLDALPAWLANAGEIPREPYGF
jgi:mannosyl-3-phosphoglycerate phosphatase